MPGSMRERRPGVWELRVFLGHDAAGKTRHRSVTFRGAKRAAGRELSRLVMEAENGPVLPTPPPIDEPRDGATRRRSMRRLRVGKRTDGGSFAVHSSALRKHVDETCVRIDRHGEACHAQPVRRREVFSAPESRWAGRSDRSSDPGADASGLPAGSKVEWRRAAQSDRRHRVARLGSR